MQETTQGVPQALNRDMSGATLVWSNPLGRMVKRLAASIDFSLICASVLDDDNLYAMNSEGKVLWKGPVHGGVADIQMSLEGQSIVATSSTGVIALYDRAGKQQWTYMLGSSIPLVAVSRNGSVVVAVAVPQGGKGQVLYIMSSGGQISAQITTVNEIKTVDLSFDGSVIVIGDSLNNLYMYGKNGARQWSVLIPSTLRQVVVSQSGAVILARTGDGLVSVSPSGTERWKLPVSGLLHSALLSHDGAVNIGCASSGIFRFDQRGSLLWNHTIPLNSQEYRLTYRSHQIVITTREGFVFWDKYGYEVFTIPVPRDLAPVDGRFVVSQDGRFIAYPAQTGAVNLIDMGRFLARHMIDTSQIFLEELNRLGTKVAGAEDNIQWGREALDEGDVQNAMIFTWQAYSGLEAALDSIPTRRGASAASGSGSGPGAPLAPDMLLEAYKKVLDTAWAEGPPTERERRLITVLRETLGIGDVAHSSLENEVKAKRAAASEVQAAAAAPQVAAPVEEAPKPLPDFQIEVVPATSTPAPAEVPSGQPSPPLIPLPEAPPAPAPSPEAAPAPAPVPAPAAPAEEKKEGTFNMDSYVSSLLSKHLSK